MGYMNFDKYFGGSARADTLRGTNGSDSIWGDAGDDNIFGGNGNDLVAGGVGKDTLDGGDGNDGLQGGDGNDVLKGGKGNDFLSGDMGNDVLIGGAGADKFVFHSGSEDWNGKYNTDAGRDVVKDFQNDVDKLGFFGFDHTYTFREAMSHAHTEGRNVVFDIEGATIVLQNTRMSQLDAHDFLF